MRGTCDASAYLNLANTPQLQEEVTVIPVHLRISSIPEKARAYKKVKKARAALSL